MSRALVRASIIVGVWVLGTASASAQLAPSCTISVTSIALGTYNVYTAIDEDSTGTVTYQCNSKASSVSIALSNGSSSTSTPRTLRKGSEVLTYNLYMNAARTQIWGDGTGGTSVYTVADPPNNSNVNLTIYARIPAQQDVSAGSYTDAVSAVINF